MKFKLYSFLAVLFASTSLVEGQLTLTASDLLQAGDRADYFADPNYADPLDLLTTPGGNQIWSISSASREGAYTFEVKDARKGGAEGNFPDADLVIDRFNLGISLLPEAELYLRRGVRGIEIIGLATVDSTDGLPTVRLPDPLLFQPSTLSFGSRTSDDVTTRVTVSSDIITVLTGDSSYADFIDSVAIGARLRTTFAVDGWGRVNFKDRTVDALRVKTTTMTQQTIEVKVAIFGWIDVSALGLVPDSLLPAAEFRNVIYDFYTPEDHLPAYKLTLDSSESVTRLEYQANTLVGLTELAAPSAVLRTRFNGSLLTVTADPEAGSSDRLDIYGIDGRSIESRPLSVLHAEEVFDTSSWPVGLALVVLSRNGRLAATQRVLVVR